MLQFLIESRAILFVNKTKKDPISASGDYSEGVPPVLIPNTEVKLLSAKDTYRAGGWEIRSLPDSIKEAGKSASFLFFANNSFGKKPGFMV